MGLEVPSSYLYCGGDKLPQLLETKPVIPMNTFDGPAERILGRLNEVERRFAPASLFGAGDPALLHRLPLVSIVGTREPSPDGVRLAQEVTRAVVTHGGVVVSGLARGIDTVAHKTALECGGNTVAVLGTPLTQSYPRENADLQRDLMEQQLVLSQFPDGYPSQRANFVLRNRTMALVSHGTIIIEAGEKSGTQHQGWEAIRLGRILFIPEHLLSLHFEWPRKMRDYGAFVFSSVPELIELLQEYLPSSPDAEGISAVLH
jgi:DNA processing protein